MNNKVKLLNILFFCILVFCGCSNDFDGLDINLDNDQNNFASVSIYSIQDVWDKKDELIGKNISIEGNVEALVFCTKKSCITENPCCNSCFGKPGFRKDGSDAIQIDGISNGKTVECKGDECNRECYPFEVGKKYLVTGKFNKYQNNNSYGGGYYIDLASFE